MTEINTKKSLKLLIVDDEPDLRDVLALSFKLHGFQVETAENGRQALEILASNMPDIVISDIRMPEGDGLDLLQDIRSRGHDVPVIFMTGYADVTSEEARIKGAAWLVSKPFTIEEMFEVIEKIKHAETSPELARSISG